MKKVLFCLSQMLGRGVEKSFLTLVNQLPRDQFDITVLFLEMRGEFLPLIPTDIKVGEIPMEETIRYDASHDVSTKFKIIRSIKQCKIGEACGMFYRKVIKHDPLGGFTSTFDKLPKLAEHYDVAICYHVHCAFLIRYVAEVIDAKKKVAWIHNDFETTGFPIVKYEKELNKYDRIFAVSNKIKEEFVDRLPRLKNRIYYFENFIDYGEIYSKAEAFYPEEYSSVDNKKIIVTIGALTYQKGIDIAIDAADYMVREGYNKFAWFILGAGPLKEELLSKIENKGLRNIVFLCGHRDNPYPYYKNADIYVQTSRHEGKAISIDEALALNKICIVTNVSGVEEQIVSGRTGSVVFCDAKSIATEIICVLNDKQVQNMYAENVKNWNIEKKKEDTRVQLLLDIIE